MFNVSPVSVVILVHSLEPAHVIVRVSHPVDIGHPGHGGGARVVATPSETKLRQLNWSHQTFTDILKFWSTSIRRRKSENFWIFIFIFCQFIDITLDTFGFNKGAMADVPLTHCYSANNNKRERCVTYETVRERRNLFYNLRLPAQTLPHPILRLNDEL